MGVIVEPREDEVIVTVASGHRLEVWTVVDGERRLLDVVDAG